MHELLEQLSTYLRAVRRYKWVVLTIAWAVSLTGWFWVDQLPSKYRASARIQVDSNEVLRPLLRGLAIQPDVSQRISLMSRTLLSRPNLEKLVRIADLDIQVQTDLEKELLLSQLQQEIILSGERRNASLYSISYVHVDPQIAKRVVQSLITVFVESILGEDRRDSTGAQDFLDAQIVAYEERLAKAENRLADFKRRNIGMMPGESGGYYQRREAVLAQLNAARLELSEAENRRAELRRQVEGEEPVLMFNGAGDFQATSAYDERIQILNKRLDELLLKYTERHPDVIEIRNTIGYLERERQKEIASVASLDVPQRGLQTSPVYHQMRTMLAETEARIAGLQVRVGEYEKRAEELTSVVDSIPEIEAEMQQLNRDYQVVSQQHAALLKRRESARLGESMERTTDDVKFRVVDPPFVPSKPQEPNKSLLNMIVLVGGIVAGVALALLLSILRPVFDDRRTLNKATGLPILGSVTLVQTAAQKRQALVGTVSFVSLFAVLLLTFVGLIMMSDSGVDLLTTIVDLRARFL